ncbi:MAG TPA: hypothetical protein VKD90_18940 [Gemmataceae bacterium]|nr:hypothetical protein [Gemmataceae bacterium]
MTERPVSGNGYLWVMYAAMPVVEARRIERLVADFRCEFSVDHLAEVKGGSADSPPVDTIVELWVHPDDDARLLARLRADSGVPECCSAKPGAAGPAAELSVRREALPMSDQQNDWDDIREAALVGPPAAVQKLACPKCRAALVVKFDAASPQPDGGTAGFLIIRCLRCSAGTCADGLRQAAPPWVEALGPRFQTRPGA